MVARGSQSNLAHFGANVTAFDPQTLQMLAGLKARFMAQGSDAALATQQAYQAIFGMVQQQSAMVAFAHVFEFLGLMFVSMLPLILVMRKPKKKGGTMAAH